MPRASAYAKRGPFVYAKTAALSPGLPKRYLASLPISGSFNQYSARHPPMEYVQHRLARGDAEMLTRVATAIRDWADGEQRLESTYGALFGHLAADHEAIRPTIARLLEDAPAAYRAPLVTEVVSRCSDFLFAELARGVGPTAILAYWRRAVMFEASGQLEARDRECVMAAARAVFADPRRKERYGSIESACIAAIDLLGNLPDMMPLLAELERLVGPDEEGLGEWFASVRDRQHPTPQVEPVDAPPADAPYGWTDEHLSDANSAIELPGGARAFLAAKPHDRVWVISALELRACDAAVEPMARVQAMADLAEVDPERASALAAATRDDPVLLPISRPLSRFGSLHAVEQYRDDLGIRISSFDTETDVFPNGHDQRLRRLAAQVDELAALEPWFEEIPPAGDDDGGEDETEEDDERLPGYYRLRAYLSRASYEVISEERGDWLDVTAMLGLLNKVNADAGLVHRFMAVERDYSQVAWVAAGRQEALELAIAAGAVTPADPGAAAGRGKAFEDKVLGRGC